MLTKFSKKVLLILISMFTIVIVNAQPITGYTQVYSANIKGGTIVIGNTSMHIVNPTNGLARTVRMNEISDPNNLFGGIGYTQYGNDNENMQFADIDGIPATFNSTSADLVLPAGTNTIKYARLYWGGRIDNNAININADTLRTVKIRKNTEVYSNIITAATSVDVFAVTGNETIYQSYCDVTAYIQAKGSGTFTVADIPATPGAVSSGGKFAGWSIVIAYENPTSLLNSVRIYHGYSQVSATIASISVTLNDLNVPNNSMSAADAVMSVMGWEGDGNLGATATNVEGDYIKVNDVVVANNANIGTNFWNGSISNNGVYVTAKNPDYSNQMGIDIDQMNVGTGYNILPNARSVTITFGTEADQYFPSYFAFTLRVKDPLVNINKTVSDANGNGLLESAEVLTYTLSGSNLSTEIVKNVFVVDSLPANVSYIANSMRVISCPGITAGVQTDEFDLLDRSFKGIAGNRTYLKYYLGTGASDNTGGSLQPGEGYSLSYKVQSQLIPGSVTNTATCYAYSNSDELFTDFSTAFISPAGGPLPVKLSSFSVTLNNNNALLNWITESEINNDHFEIERSDDGVHFEYRATVNGNGTTSLKHTYQLTDKLSANTYIIYYRLKIIDANGQISYSKVIPLQLKNIFKVDKVTVYPNPFLSDIKVFIKSTKAIATNFRIVSLDGKEILLRKLMVDTGDNIVILKDLQSLTKGTYVLEINNGIEKFFTKIVKGQ